MQVNNIDERMLADRAALPRAEIAPLIVPVRLARVGEPPDDAHHIHGGLS